MAGKVLLSLRPIGYTRSVAPVLPVQPVDHRLVAIETFPSSIRRRVVFRVWFGAACS